MFIVDIIFIFTKACFHIEKYSMVVKVFDWNFKLLLLTIYLIK